jgi:glutamate dehydrogenase (NAD(P)+)
MRFGRMEKRFNQNINSGMVDIIEKATGKNISDRDRKMLARGADEIDLVRSGLEETMISAFHQIRDIQNQNSKINGLRTAAFVSAINKISSDYMTLGIFP